MFYTYFAMSPGDVHVLKSALGINFLFIGVSIVTLCKTVFSLVNKNIFDKQENIR